MRRPRAAARRRAETSRASGLPAERWGRWSVRQARGGTPSRSRNSAGWLPGVSPRRGARPARSRSRIGRRGSMAPHRPPSRSRKHRRCGGRDRAAGAGCRQRAAAGRWPGRSRAGAGQAARVAARRPAAPTGSAIRRRRSPSPSTGPAPPCCRRAAGVRMASFVRGPAQRSHLKAAPPSSRTTSGRRCFRTHSQSCCGRFRRRPLVAKTPFPRLALGRSATGISATRTRSAPPGPPLPVARSRAAAVARARRGVARPRLRGRGSAPRCSGPG